MQGGFEENGYAESFHSRPRDKFLAMEEFESLAVASRLTTAWKEDDNNCRPHSSLGYVAPAKFAACCGNQQKHRNQHTGPRQMCSGMNSPRPAECFPFGDLCSAVPQPSSGRTKCR